MKNPVGAFTPETINTTAATHTSCQTIFMITTPWSGTATEAEAEDESGVAGRVVDAATFVRKRATISTSDDNLLLTKSLT